MGSSPSLPKKKRIKPSGSHSEEQGDSVKLVKRQSNTTVSAVCSGVHRWPIAWGALARPDQRPNECAMALAMGRPR